MVLKEGLEPSRLATVVFETTASAIPPFEYMYQGTFDIKNNLYSCCKCPIFNKNLSRYSNG